MLMFKTIYNFFFLLQFLSNEITTIAFVCKNGSYRFLSIKMYLINFNTTQFFLTKFICKYIHIKILSTISIIRNQTNCVRGCVKVTGNTAADGFLRILSIFNRQLYTYIYIITRIFM